MLCTAGYPQQFCWILMIFLSDRHKSLKKWLVTKTVKLFPKLWQRFLCSRPDSERIMHTSVEILAFIPFVPPYFIHMVFFKHASSVTFAKELCTRVYDHHPANAWIINIGPTSLAEAGYRQWVETILYTVNSDMALIIVKSCSGFQNQNLKHRNMQKAHLHVANTFLPSEVLD